MRELKFRTVIVDVDSTLSRIEGIEWLARLRGPEMFERINEMTERAMRGELEFDGVFAARLEAVRPTRAEIIQLGDIYIENISVGAMEAIQRLCDNDVRVLIVSGGIRDAVIPLAEHVGIAESDVHAVPLFFDESGEYSGYDSQHPCTMQMGKQKVVTGLDLHRPALLIGDGMTDAEVRPAVDAFAAFTGAVRRERIVELADFELASFDDLFAHITT